MPRRAAQRDSRSAPAACRDHATARGGAPPAAPVLYNDRGAVSAAANAAWSLLKVNTNQKRGGGAQLFHENVGCLYERLRDLPHGDLRSQAVRHLDTMKKVKKLNTPGSWRPYVFCVLRLLGIPKCQLEREYKAHYVTKEAVVEAEATTALETADQGPAEAPQERAGSASPREAQPEPIREKQGIERFLVVGHKARSVEEVQDEPGEEEHHKQMQDEPGGQQRKSQEGKVQDKQGEEDPKQVQEEPGEEHHKQMQDEPGGQQRKSQQGKGQQGKRQQGKRQQRKSQAGKSQEGKGQRKRQQGKRQQQEQRASPSQKGLPPRQKPHGCVPSSHMGYCATLGLTGDEGYSELRAAYKAKALAHHPDKGGTEEQFRAIQEALEKLSEYYKKSEAPGGDGDAPTVEQAAKAAHAHLLAQPKESWGRILGGLNLEALTVLEASLRHTPQGQEALEEKEASADGVLACLAGSAKADYTARTGVNRMPNGCYAVQVCWRAFKVRGQVATLEQALDLHSCLVQARSAALARHKAVLDDLARLGCGHQQQREANLDDCPMLTLAELLSVMQEEPGVGLIFASDFSNPRFQSPWTPSLESALRFRVSMRTLKAWGGDVSAAKRNMLEVAKGDREARAALGAQVAARVSEEASRRRDEAATWGLGRLPPPAEPERLALMEVAAAAEVERLREALESEQQRNRDALARVEEAWRSSAERAEEQWKQQLEEARRAGEEAETRQAQRAEEADQRRELAEERANRYADQCLAALQAPRLPANPFRWQPPQDSRGAARGEGLREDSLRAAMRECRDRKLHIRPTDLEPEGSYGLCAKRARV